MQRKITAVFLLQHESAVKMSGIKTAVLKIRLMGI